MKKTILLLIILSLSLLIFRCSNKTYFKEVVSDKKVSITLREVGNESYYNLNIPIKFILNFNKSKIISSTLYYEIDNKQGSIIEDYLLINGDNNKIIFGFDNYKLYNYPNSIYVIGQKNKISKDKALELIQKYNAREKLERIRNRNDTIYLTSYSQYRKDYPGFLKEMRKIPDSLHLNVRLDGKKVKIIGEQIKW